MNFLSAGHHKKDPGAVSGNLKEANLTIELRDLIVAEIKALGGSVIIDDDNETLAQYIRRIKPGNGSVLLEIHFNSSATGLGKGVEVLIPDSYDTDDMEFAKEILSAVVDTCGLISRGVITESKSRRGRLGILRTKAKVSGLVEVCFINNASDMQLYNNNKKKLAKELARIIVKYDNLYS